VVEHIVIACKFLKSLDSVPQLINLENPVPYVDVAL
jgi:hypothetical protein